MGNWEKWKGKNEVKSSQGKRMLNRFEAAEFLGVHVRTIDNRIAQKSIRNYKFGGCVRFAMADLEEYLSERSR